MGVPLQLILGILLILATCSLSENRNIRQIREAPPPTTSSSNATELNNRDLNKIVKDTPKTEIQESKLKSINNVNNFETFSGKLGDSNEEYRSETENVQKNKTEGREESFKENGKKDNLANLAKDRLREGSPRAIDIDTSKFWSQDFHSKSNGSPTGNLAAPENSFEGTRHPRFDSNVELTTPTTKFFDQKFKETVESVEQKLEDAEVENEAHSSEEDETNDEDLVLEDRINIKPVNSSLNFEKTKTIVNNETIDKNSIHKDLNIEQTKSVIFENVYKDTKVYDEEAEANKGDREHYTTEKVSFTKASSRTTTKPIVTTSENSLVKESAEETNTSHTLSNNIETDFVTPLKGLTTTISSTTAILSDLHNLKVTPSTQTPGTSRIGSPTRTLSTISTEATSVMRTNIPDEENLIPLHLGTETISSKESSSEPTGTSNNISVDDSSQNESMVSVNKIVISTASTITNAAPITTTRVETTTESLTTDVLSDATTTIISIPESTILGIVRGTEPSTSAAETSTSAASTTLAERLSETNIRTSKSLDNPVVTEKMIDTSESTLAGSTKIMEITTESTIRNELDSTTSNNGKVDDMNEKINNPPKVKVIVESTTTDETTATTFSGGDETTTSVNIPEILPINNVSTTARTTERFQTASEESTVVNTTSEYAKENMSTEHSTLSQIARSASTTTEFTFVHIENAVSDHTTILLPELLSPNLNYSTSTNSDNEQNEIRKIFPNGNTIDAGFSISSSTTPSSISEEPSNITTTTEEQTETTPSGHGFTKDGDSDGSNKGKIAAIAISAVGAVCLVILAGLLYVMKKRQRRLNYGPRCRPVSLDDYSIDNLSVYNSVRRKGGAGGARMSKRSFGNPAFDDPVAPTHPLNFLALSKFSTNLEDIKAEFEEIPQITAKTSELPDGCDTKNRYANVIPLPETRVFLKQIDGYSNSDYINANYVMGPRNIKGYYIATQGPMQNTVEDFWKMVWEQQAKVILMLTHLVENGLEKCVDYLPESEVLECSRLFGDYQITLKKREVKEKYIISSLQLKNMVSNSWREVTHFWYLGWPEKGVPSEANSLIAFLIEARSYMKTATIDKKDGVNGIQNGGAHKEHNPVVVHCSPGTGRTGVAIACDIAIREFETARLVDIPKIVYRIRRDRANSVQTKEQYMFIYKVVCLYATKLTGGALENV